MEKGKRSAREQARERESKTVKDVIEGKNYEKKKWFKKGGQE